jgi:hypothetical protein
MTGQVVTRRHTEGEGRQLVGARLRAIEYAPYLAHALFAVRPVAAEGLGTFAVDRGWRRTWTRSAPGPRSPATDDRTGVLPLGTYPDVHWAWVPTIQGWQIDVYVRHAAELAPLIAELQRA